MCCAVSPVCQSQLVSVVSQEVKSTTARLQEFGKASQWQCAIERLAELQGLADLIAYSAAITACARGSAWQQALILIAELHESRTRLDVITYGAGISACEKGGAWQQSGFLLQGVLDEQIQPNAVVYNAAISGFGRGSKWQDAEILLAKLFQSKVRGDSTTRNAIISAKAKAVEWCSALFDVREFRGRCLEPDVITRNAAAASLRQRWRLGHLFLHKLPRHTRDVLTYNTTLSAFGDGGKEVWRLSLAVLDELLTDGFQADVFSFSASSACEASGQWEEAQQLLNLLLAHQVQRNIVAINATVSTLDKSSQ